MEQEVKIKQIIRLNILEHSLMFLSKLLDLNSTYFTEDIEIEPFDKFSPEFSSEYWFLKYNLLKEGKYIIESNFNYLFKENNINNIWITLSDLENYKLTCKDGTWYIEFFNSNRLNNELILNLKKNGFI